MNTILKLGVLGAAMIALSSPAMAEEGSKGDRAQKMQHRLKAADKDNDGKISKAEADASLPRLAKHFGEIDTNQDGFLTKEEMRAWHQAHGGQRKEQK